MTFIAGMKGFFQTSEILHFISQTNTVLCSIVVHFKCPCAPKFNFTDVDSMSDPVLYYPFKLVFSALSRYHVLWTGEQEICYGTQFSENITYSPLKFGYFPGKSYLSHP